MSVLVTDLADGVVLTGSQFSEPMRAVGTPVAGEAFLLVTACGRLFLSRPSPLEAAA